MGEQNRAGGTSDGNARVHVGRKGQAQVTATLQLAGTSWGELVLGSQIEGDSDAAGSSRPTVPNSPMWNGLALGGRPTWHISQLPQKALDAIWSQKCQESMLHRMPGFSPSLSPIPLCGQLRGPSLKTGLIHMIRKNIL